MKDDPPTWNFNDLEAMDEKMKENLAIFGAFARLCFSNLITRTQIRIKRLYKLQIPPLIIL